MARHDLRHLPRGGQHLLRLDLDVRRAPRNPAEPWWIISFEFGSAKRFPGAPLQRIIAPADNAIPTQIVRTSGLTYARPAGGSRSSCASPRSSPSDDRIGPVFAALADPSRRQLVQHLATCESGALTELAATLPVSRQVVSKHLAALGEALTWVERVGVELDDRLRALRDHLTT